MANKPDGKNPSVEPPVKEPPIDEPVTIREPAVEDVPDEKLVHPDDGSHPHPPRMKGTTRPEEAENGLTRGGG
ncbi:hypothetical protein BH10PSE7_BH10PSE7_38760 [soil metagenome]